MSDESKSAKSDKPPASKSTPPASAKGAGKGTSTSKTEGKSKVASTEAYDLPKSWHAAWKIAGGVGVVGVGATASQMFGSGESAARASYSYVFGFYVFLTIALGSLFFVLIQHLTSAGWSVTMRRTAEFFASALPVFLLLFLPLIPQMKHLYPWSEEFVAEHGEHDQKEHAAGPKEHASIPFVGVAHAQEGPAEPKEAPAGSAGAAKPEHKDGTGSGHGNGGGAGHGNGSGAGHEGKAHAGGAEHHAKMLPFEMEQEEILEGKRHGWLNKSFFLARAVVYFAIWSLLGWFFFKNSTLQDRTKDPKLTVLQQKWAPLCTFAFGLSLTFAAFDWLMSLDPMWFSTIYGVYIFATCVVSGFATIIVVTMALRDAGPLQKVVTVEHYHDIGKLLFGFNVFWAYIGFSQMMLIWYAALPAETPFYHKRWETPSSVILGNHSGDFWTNVTMAIVLGHFVIAFLFLISRNTKRRLPMLRLGAYWMILMHMLDMYWFVLPNFEPNLKAAGFSVSWTDFTALLGVGGIYLAVVFFRMTKHALIPTGDPRLARSIAFQNA